MPRDGLIRRALAVAAAAAVVIVVWGVAFDRAPSATDRVDSLASRLRCPVCSSESIADSTSQIARELRGVIAEQVAGGATDDDVVDFFVARYGEWVLLDPPARGRNLLLFALPVLALGGGLAAMIGLRARSRRRDPAPATTERVRLEAASAQARQDIVEAELQHEAGELDAATRDRLVAVYAAEESAAAAALEELPEPARRSRGRALAGAAAFALGGAIVVAGVVVALEPRPEGGFATGGIVTGAAEGTAPDLAAVSNEELEEVVAANPDVPGMRLALARRYLDEREFDKALAHLLVVLEQDPSAEALAYVGWLTYLGGEPDLGVTYLERSLAADADRPEALWFLALARLETGADPATAVPLLERLLDNPDLGTEERAMVAETLEQARARAS